MTILSSAMAFDPSHNAQYDKHMSCGCPLRYRYATAALPLALRYFHCGRAMAPPQGVGGPGCDAQQPPGAPRGAPGVPRCTMAKKQKLPATIYYLLSTVYYLLSTSY